ncbi:FAD:protein FMN transferase [Denitromonas ohlonensis]|uniref:FAD:protein FMN transferase n=2 Tax=Denitromonas TaxID=139331 RepID=A0A557RTI0_9RHOO|nr:FAD:protein FMN transferase [Denitromonas ohlonensis]TVO68466.1 FAD:protein FMN transferase [Denitromonas ohlonensis]TVO74744.1 FAD:protein FMN transferase [Denitromonas ohlonensis]TVT72237.1 MAG: FAD:protein FMN transferase [Denitromonas halophila]
MFLRIVLLCLTVTLVGCSRSAVHQQEAFVFGTRVEVLVWGDDAERAQQAMGAVLREFDRLHKAFHAWKPSELTALNRMLAAGQRAQVSAELATMLNDAKALAATGDQLFNPALGKLVALWGFHDDQFSPRRPDPAALQALVSSAPNMADVHLDADGVASDNPDVQFDLGGYAKGYALDRAAAILRAEGVDNALINIGGNVMALGRKGDHPWQVGIQHPRAPQPIAVLALYDGEAIGTSGDYQRYFELDGRRFSHLIDPRSGQPASGTQAVTVLVSPQAGAGVLSDVASKPVFLAGDAWREMAHRYGVEMALRVDGDGRIAVTRALRARMKPFGGIEIDQVVD